jgi:HK97 family phage prohead protease
VSDSMSSKKEIRMLPLKELRFNEDDTGAIVGHASVFDSWSETLGCLFPFKEIVRKGAFLDTIVRDDIRALFNHDPNYVLGRNKAGTLELSEDEIGLSVRITPPNTSWAKDLVMSIKRGDISQMSIGFIVEEDTWGTKDGIDIREIRKVQLFDVSPVTFPAYLETDVGVRAMEEYKNYKAGLTEADVSLKKAKAKEKINNLKTKFKNL